MPTVVAPSSRIAEAASQVASSISASIIGVAKTGREPEPTVGIKVEITHDKASAMGATVSASAKLEAVDGRRLVFSVSAKDDNGNIIGKGTIERFVVNCDKFMKKVNG